MTDRGVSIHFEELLGRGGFGSVYRASMAWRDGLTRRVAVKVLNAEVEGISEAVTRTRDEARVLLRLNHENIIGVLDLTEIEGRPAMIMEYIEGCDLKALMRDGPMPPRAVLGVIAAVASGLEAANQGTDPRTNEPLNIVHRDVKPGNVLISVGGSIKLVDFGVAFGDLERESRTCVDQVGTMRYMAPEQFLGGGAVHQSDIYSLGLVMAELLLGRTVQRMPADPEKFEGQFAVLLEDIDKLGMDGEWGAEVRALLGRMLEFTPFDRPDAAEVRDQAEALHDAGSGTSIKAYARQRVPVYVNERRQRYALAELLQDVSLTEFGSTTAGESSSSSGAVWLARASDGGPPGPSTTMIPMDTPPPVPDDDPGGRTTFIEAPNDASSEEPVRGAWWVGLGAGLALAVLSAVVVLAGMMGLMGETPFGDGEPDASTAVVDDAASGDEVVTLPGPEAGADEPAGDEPAGEEPVAEEPVAEEPGAEVVEEAAAGDPEPAVVATTEDPSEAEVTAVIGVDPAAATGSPGEEPAAEGEGSESEEAAAGEEAVAGEEAAAGEDASASTDGDGEAVAAAEAAAESQEAPEQEPVEAPHFAGLTGTWSGTAGGQSARFKLSFDSEGNVRGVVDMYIGGTRSVVPLSGSYRATDWTTGSIELRESEGRRPVTYSGKITGGNTVSGNLAVQGKDRGEWSIRKGG